jgi:hypothetical protein
MCFEGSDYFPCCGRLVEDIVLIHCTKYWQGYNPSANGRMIPCTRRRRLGLDAASNICEDCSGDLDDAILCSLWRLFVDEAQVYTNITYTECALSETWRERIGWQSIRNIGKLSTSVNIILGNEILSQKISTYRINYDLSFSRVILLWGHYPQFM